MSSSVVDDKLEVHGTWFWRKYAVDFVKEDKNSYEVQSKPELSSRKHIFNLCVKNKWVLTEMTPIETKLEDIFRELTMN